MHERFHAPRQPIVLARFGPIVAPGSDRQGIDALGEAALRLQQADDSGEHGLSSSAAFAGPA